MIWGWVCSVTRGPDLLRVLTFTRFPVHAFQESYTCSNSSTVAVVANNMCQLPERIV